MKPILLFPCVLVLALPGASAPQQRAAETLGRYDFSSPVAVNTLPAPLREASGLALAPDGRMYAHADESAEVFEIDRGGRVSRSFTLGSPALAGDFEGIAAAGGSVYLATSTGAIHEFRPGPMRSPTASVTYRTYETGLADRCEVEGLAHDARAGELLLACKNTFAGDLRGRFIVFAFSLRTHRLDPAPRVSIPLRRLRGQGGQGEFHASGIEVHPSGSLYVLSARGPYLAEVRAPATVVAVRTLGRRRHPQPEGLTFLADGTLALADEGSSDGEGRLTLYRPSAPQRP